MSTKKGENDAVIRGQEIDFLILNASNFPKNIIYPYAFVQVSAIARSHGITVSRYDLIGESINQWREVVSSLIDIYAPRCIGITLRQADSQFVEDYAVKETKESAVGYHPVEDTRYLIEIIRTLCETPIAVGGFGFTVHSESLFRFLAPDYGIVGGPDSFFNSFEQILLGNPEALSQVGNLIYRDSGGLMVPSRRSWASPFSGTEYDDIILSEIIEFYTSAKRTLSVNTIGEVDIAVEIMRGCPCNCFFCTEPDVKGGRVRYREIDIVVEEIRFLLSRGIRSFWLVCSELNMGGLDYPLRLAARLTKLQEGLEDGDYFIWKSYLMPRPRINDEDFAVLINSGFVPGWNEFVSLDENNLLDARVPYKVDDALRFLNQVENFVSGKYPEFLDFYSKFELFLGNQFSTRETLRNTIKVASENNLEQKFRSSGIISATRIYRKNLDKFKLDRNFISSFQRSGKGPLNLIFPSFSPPPNLLKYFQDEQELASFFNFVSDCILSRRHSVSFDTLMFLKTLCHLEFYEIISRCRHAAITVALLDVEATAVKDLAISVFLGTKDDAFQILNKKDCSASAHAIHIIWTVLGEINRPGVERVFSFFDLPIDRHLREQASTISLIEILYNKRKSGDQVLADLEIAAPSNDCLYEKWFFHHFLMSRGILISSVYRSVLMD